MEDFFKNKNVNLSKTERMPLLFIGHGSPMNAIENNNYTTSWKELGKILPVPKAILCISAHWLTSGTFVTTMQNPRTIHDFGGFPKILYEQQYPAPGTPEFAEKTRKLVKSPKILSDFEWGFDHGTWSVLLPMFPLAKIPVFQLSIDYYKPTTYHYDLAKQLSDLRSEGVLIIGSGNIVHNLGRISSNSNPYDWAVEFDQKITSYLENSDHKSVIDFQDLDKLAQIAHPTFDHFIPLLYIIGLQQKTDKMEFFNLGFDMASISMRSVIYY
jgi:4,5-DOPA dioxygenase extradiol